MHRTSKQLVAATAAALVLGGFSASALANRRQSAFSGIAQHGSDASCFTNGNGAIKNEFCSTRQFCVPLIYDFNPFGNFANVVVTAKAPTGLLMSCFTQTVTKQGDAFANSGLINTVMNGTWVDVPLNGGGLPDGGAAYTCCNIPQGGQISVLNY